MFAQTSGLQSQGTRRRKEGAPVAPANLGMLALETFRHVSCTSRSTTFNAGLQMCVSFWGNFEEKKRNKNLLNSLQDRPKRASLKTLRWEPPNGWFPVSPFSSSLPTGHTVPANQVGLSAIPIASRSRFGQQNQPTDWPYPLQRKVRFGCPPPPQIYGCGSKPMVPFWGRCTTHFSLF